MSGLSTAYQIIPVTEAPSQSITVTLAGQLCVINLYTKSTNIPAQNPNEIASDPTPRYENVNPCFIDLFLNGSTTPVVGGVYVRQGSLIVRDTYLGFVGDLAVLDMSGAGEDPIGVPPRLPPPPLRNALQLATFPISLGNMAPASVAGTIPGMGVRWLLTYWPIGSYVPGYSLPR